MGTFFWDTHFALPFSSYYFYFYFCVIQVALVTWTESVGLTLVHRDLSSMRLRTPYGQILVFNILQIFPFTSESKRMGIIVKVRSTVLPVKIDTNHLKTFLSKFTLFLSI